MVNFTLNSLKRKLYNYLNSNQMFSWSKNTWWKQVLREGNQPFLICKIYIVILLIPGIILWNFHARMSVGFLLKKAIISRNWWILQLKYMVYQFHHKRTLTISQRDNLIFSTCWVSFFLSICNIPKVLLSDAKM